MTRLPARLVRPGDWVMVGYDYAGHTHPWDRASPAWEGIRMVQEVNTGEDGNTYLWYRSIYDDWHNITKANDPHWIIDPLTQEELTLRYLQDG